MKKINLILGFLLLFGITISCNQEGIGTNLADINTAASGNLDAIFDITNDNSGIVKITPKGDGVTSFSVNFGDGTTDLATVSPGSSTSHVFAEGNYNVTIVAANIAGGSSQSSFPLVVVYRAPEGIIVTKNITAHNMTVSATASYAKSFLVYFGDVANEVGTPMAKGQTLPAHTYAAAGNYDLKVVALSGGAAKSQLIVPITIYDPFGLPITFESAFINYFFGTFDDWGQQQFATVDNPDKSGLNTSNKVGKFTNGHAGWSGTYSPLNYPIDFSNGKVITLLAYIPDAANIGNKLNVELEWAIDGNPGNGVAVLKMPITVANQWELLTFDYSGIAGIPANAKFTQLVFRYNDTASGSSEIVYIDNIQLTN